MDPKSDMLASSGEDIIAFDLSENLLSQMHQDGRKGEQSEKVVQSSDHTHLLQFPFLWPQVSFASIALDILASLGTSTAS
jgi:hypothetical protein